MFYFVFQSTLSVVLCPLKRTYINAFRLLKSI